MIYSQQELLDAIGFEYGQHHVHPDALNHSAVNLIYLERQMEWYVSLSDRVTTNTKPNYWDKMAIRTMRRILLWQQVRDYQAALALRSQIAESVALLEWRQQSTNGLWLKMVQGEE